MSRATAFVSDRAGRPSRTVPELSVSGPLRVLRYRNGTLKLQVLGDDATLDEAGLQPVDGRAAGVVVTEQALLQALGAALEQQADGSWAVPAPVVELHPQADGSYAPVQAEDGTLDPSPALS